MGKAVSTFCKNRDREKARVVDPKVEHQIPHGDALGERCSMVTSGAGSLARGDPGKELIHTVMCRPGREGKT